MGTPHGLTVEERFWLKVDRDGDCWEWTASLSSTGYGQMMVNAPGEPQRLDRAHRISWRIHHGEIPDGLVVMHLCDNPLCVNPDHLAVGTQKANMLDASNKDRINRKSLGGQDHPGSKLTDEDVTTIRWLRTRGWLLREIAEKFDVGTSQVWRICTGQHRSDAA